MNTALALVCLLALRLAGSVSDSEWESFKAKHGKKYPHPELDTLRRHIYDETLKKIEAHNALYDQGQTSYYLGENHLSDWLDGEINSYLKGLKMRSTPEGSCVHQMSGLERPDSVDWRTKGIVTKVKEQHGSTDCGSCWAFGTTGAVEGQHALKTGKLVDLSEQQLVDCDSMDDGCGGGFPTNALNYIQQYGQEAENSYPYKAVAGQCEYNSSRVVATITGFCSIGAGDEEGLQDAIATVGPITVLIDALHLDSSYRGGIFDPPSCSTDLLDHAVLVVGYGTDTNGKQYYIVKNSWGSDWGIHGYMLMSRNNNNSCGIATAAVYPTV